MAKQLIKQAKFVQSIKKIIKAFDALEIDWCLIGGRAVEMRTNPPQSPDIDLLCSAQDATPREILEAFDNEGIRLKERYEPGDIAFMKDIKNGTEIDVMPSFDPFDAAVILRAGVIKLKGLEIPVAIAEDLVMMKARAACDSSAGLIGRPKDKAERDVAAIKILAGDNDLDLKYIKETLIDEHWDDELALLKKAGVLK